MRVQTLSCFALFFPGDHIWHIEGIPYFWLNGWLWLVDVELWCWRRLLRVTWTARSNQSILKEINPEYWKDWCWSWVSNTLVTWCKELIHWKRPWCWERLRVEERGLQGIEIVDGIPISLDICLSKLWEIVKDREAWRAAVHGVTVKHDWLLNNNGMKGAPLGTVRRTQKKKKRKRKQNQKTVTQAQLDSMFT